MRPRPARVILSLITIGALAAGVVTSQFIFIVVALGALVLLVTSLATSRQPFTKACLRFRDQAVAVRVWGVPPPTPPGTTLILKSVNALGAGAHLFFDAGGGVSMHLKVAQPRHPTLTPDTVIVGSARYVQWNGKKLPRVGSAPALSIASSDAFRPLVHE